MDRDLNAAININVAGSAPETLNARGGSVRPVGNMSLADPVKREPSQHDYAVRLGADNRKTVLWQVFQQNNTCYNGSGTL